MSSARGIVDHRFAAPVREDRLVGTDMPHASERLDHLYRSRAKRLLSYFARRAGSRDAPDLVQESFTRLAAAQSTAGHTVNEPAAYLQQIATNLMRDRAREALRRSMNQHVVAEEHEVAPDPVRALEARDILSRVQQALARLSPTTRAIFLAHRVEGLRYAEIAEQNGLSVKGVEWHMTKAIACLDRTLRSR